MRRSTFVVSLLAALGGGGTARAELILLFQGTTPGQDLNVQVGPESFAPTPTGVRQFSVVGGSDAARFGPTVAAFCAEIREDLSTKSPVPYEVVPLASLPDVANPWTGTIDPANKVKYLTELVGRYASQATTAVGAAAFAYAVWEILYDDVSSLGSGGGNVTLTGTSVGSPAGQLADGWLASLSADASYFTGNPQYAGMEVVGLYSPTYQDQIAVRAVPTVPAPAGAVLAAVGLVLFAGRRAVRTKAG